MATYTVTAAQVQLVSGSPFTSVANAAIAAGKSCYYDPTTGKWGLADANATATIAGAYGLAVSLSSADADGSQIVLAGPGCVVNIGAGAAIAVGKPIIVSATAGGLADAGDVVTAGNFVSIVGHGGPVVNYMKVIGSYPGAALA